MEFEFKEKYDIDDLCGIMKILRSENGCPWDKVQTHKSIRKDLIEECYEAAEAIDCDDPAMMREELGDVLLQVVFHSEMEEERGNFSFGDVVNEVCQKLVDRHPHVFGNVKADSTEEALDSWNNAKQQLKGQKTYSETLDSVSRALPALMRAQKLCSRAKRSGMTFVNRDAAADMIAHEAAALKENEFDSAEIIGRILFLTAELAWLDDADAEECLSAESEKFIDDFRVAEKNIRTAD